VVGSKEKKGFNVRLPTDLLDLLKERSEGSDFKIETIAFDALSYALAKSDDLSAKRLTIFREYCENQNKRAEGEKPPRNKTNH